MANQHINKVVYDGTVLIDLTDSTVDEASLLAGLVAYAADGSRIIGTLADGDSLGYGLATSPYVNVARSGSAVVHDIVTDVAGQALTEYAVLTA